MIRHGLPIVKSIWYIIGKETPESVIKFTHTFNRTTHFALNVINTAHLVKKHTNFVKKCSENTSQSRALTPTFHCHFVTAQLLCSTVETSVAPELNRFSTF